MFTTPCGSYFGRVQDPILRFSCTRVRGKTSGFVSERHASTRFDGPHPAPNFLSSGNPEVYLMNNLCMLWSLLEDVYMNIGYRSGIPPQNAADVLQSVWAKTGEEGKKGVL